MLCSTLGPHVHGCDIAADGGTDGATYGAAYRRSYSCTDCDPHCFADSSTNSRADSGADCGADSGTYYCANGQAHPCADGRAVVYADGCAHSGTNNASLRRRLARMRQVRRRHLLQGTHCSSIRHLWELVGYTTVVGLRLQARLLLLVGLYHSASSARVHKGDLGADGDTYSRTLSCTDCGAHGIPYCSAFCSSNFVAYRVPNSSSMRRRLAWLSIRVGRRHLLQGTV